MLDWEELDGWSLSLGGLKSCNIGTFSETNIDLKNNFENTRLLGSSSDGWINNEGSTMELAISTSFLFKVKSTNKYHNFPFQNGESM